MNSARYPPSHGLGLIISILLFIIVLLEFRSPAPWSFSAFYSLEPTTSDSPLHTVATVYKPSRGLEDVSPAGDDAWSALMTARGSFLRIAHNETFDFGWGVSMYHSLHCLSMVRTAFQSATRDLPPTHDHHNDESLPHTQVHSEHLDVEHVGHCLRYIAQSLQCFGDDTLEPARLIKDSAGNIVRAEVDGDGFQHQCKDTSEWQKVVEESGRNPVQAPEWRPGLTISDFWKT